MDVNTSIPAHLEMRIKQDPVADCSIYWMHVYILGMCTYGICLI